MGIGGWEVLVILFVVLLVFGPKRIPEVARGISKGVRELRRVTTEFQRELNLEAMEAEEKPRTPSGGSAMPPALAPPSTAPRESPDSHAPASKDSADSGG